MRTAQSPNTPPPIAPLSVGAQGSTGLILFLLRDQHAVDLDADEIHAISTLYAKLQTEKGEYETRIADVEMRGPSTMEVNSPELREFGDILRARWYSGLETAIGTQRTTALLASSPPFDYLFSCYGNATQSYQVTAVLARDGTTEYQGDYQIVTAEKMTDAFTRGKNSHAPFVSAENSISIPESELAGGDHEVLRHFVGRLTPAAP